MELTQKYLNNELSESTNTNTYLNHNPGKKYTRFYKQTFTPDRVSITQIKNNYFIGHLTPADLSLLKDFDQFKDELDIVNDSNFERPYFNKCKILFLEIQCY